MRNPFGALKLFRGVNHQSHALVACPPQALVSQQLPRDGLSLIAQAVSVAVDLDLTDVARSFPLQEDREWFTLWPGEHYAFLMALARVMQPALVLDIGTYHGASALAVSYHSQRVITYDICPLSEIGNAYVGLTADHPNVEQVIGDLSNPDFFVGQQSLVQQADVTVVDGPKDGDFEYVVVPKLVNEMKRGSVLVLDDIRFENMIDLWMSLDKPRIDVGCFAHSSGTGIIFL